MRIAAGLLVLAFWMGAAAGAEPTLAEKQAAAKKQQAELRERIEQLQKEIDGQESSRRDAASELKESESAISAINRRLAELSESRRHAENELKDLAKQTEEQQRLLAKRRHELGEQLRAQYAGGLSPWAALLSGDDPQQIGRDLSYLGYVTRAQAAAVQAVREALARLEGLRQRTETGRKELARLVEETSEQKASLEKQTEERRKVLARIESRLAEQRGQAERLARNDARLGNLVAGLEKAIIRQAEEARIAEEKRKAEAARRAAELARRREAARKAEEEARIAQARAQRERERQEAEQARLQVEQAREEAKRAEQAERAELAARTEQAERAEQAQQAERARQAEAAREPASRPARAEPSGGFKGLRKGLPYPVRGEVLGRFGAQRPDGGLWRGIVLRSPEGTAVRAIEAGRVVYASWLSGFGNIMIVDHGAKFLSVYAYNQSLLKQVGDIVHGGDTIATVGATGGQVDPGLYFEIRHQGTPVNPLLWLKP
ncbi:murein hydrolase activator EnvC family protein [Parapusillimonas granuli]|uniref:Peptidoglycan DD-metalloendopeptidase family protein n=1 Tax=Parapusillimonas granuli TaxID=380911 RepID=A0A853G1A8_9BURK|nr:peptidoglycan DD-metalloendopeptidase family protein [Parapusillimonas granuli]MBB5214762.1 septal ring factor EnvC (AmiA/AmiB activator) [Parapusillimonas granuli]MEB2397990.1 peptidoglycan DD-metalloendopeptidase family protein [Alcaligenaceae bacterium]NYT48830.1 peptidoglycan DD-metalloendopeptidase family protein [Parapusillimonas granuli]